MATYRLIARSGSKKRHLRDGDAQGAGGKKVYRALCGQIINGYTSRLSSSLDARDIDCEDCLVAGIRLGADRLSKVVPA